MATRLDLYTVSPLQNLDKWQAALKRARREGIKLFQSRETGEFYALSSDGKRLYSVSVRDCACKAGLNGYVCKHRAALLAHLGRLTDESPEPTDPAPAAARPVPTDPAPSDFGLTNEEIIALKADAMRRSVEIGYLIDWRTGRVQYDRPLAG